MLPHRFSATGLNLLVTRYLDAELKVFPAVHEETATDVPLKKLSQAYKDAKVSRLSIAAKSTGALAHLKLYGIGGSERDTAWLYCTSANCTEAAWSGSNVEAGILRSIPHSELSLYFATDDRALPQGLIGYEQKGSSGDILHFWASGIDARIDIVVSENCASYLPLRDVIMTVRSGSSLEEHRKETFFEEGRFGHIDWKLFTDRQRLLLTADPVHRSAWRGTLMLLSEEGVPELADIAAIFTLARDVFGGTLIRTPKVVPTDVGDAKAHNERTPVAVAVWPPLAEFPGLHKRIGGTGAGQLQWFQRILTMLLQDEKSETVTYRLPDEEPFSDGTDEPGSKERRAKEEKHKRTVAAGIWAKAKNEYDHIQNRLLELCPTSENAPNIWPAAVFAFLFETAIFRAVRRIAPGVDFGTDAGTLCEEFIWTMLHERKQGDDFCCPKNSRYRHDKFPALAEDLRETFTVQLHFELTTVVLSLIIDQKLRCSAESGLQSWRLSFQRVCDEDFVADANTLAACQRIWRRYLRDVIRKETDSEFAEVFNAICNTKLPIGAL